MRYLSLILCASLLKAVCPTPANSSNWGQFAWQPGIGVGYGWPAAGPPPGAYTNLSIDTLGIGFGPISTAFTQWTSANSASNPSNTGFYYNGSGPFRVYAVSVNFPGVPFQGDPRKSAETLMGLLGGTNVLAIASTTFYFGSISLFGFPNIDQNAANYHTFIQKVMLHEIGHTMGIDDQPVGLAVCGGQVAGQSVMNAQCGTNDQANNMATNVTSCDNATVL